MLVGLALVVGGPVLQPGLLSDYVLIPEKTSSLSLNGLKYLKNSTCMFIFISIMTVVEENRKDNYNMGRRITIMVRDPTHPNR